MNLKEESNPGEKISMPTNELITELQKVREENYALKEQLNKLTAINELTSISNNELFNRFCDACATRGYDEQPRNTYEDFLDEIYTEEITRRLIDIGFLIEQLSINNYSNGEFFSNLSNQRIEIRNSTGQPVYSFTNGKVCNHLEEQG